MIIQAWFDQVFYISFSMISVWSDTDLSRLTTCDRITQGGWKYPYGWAIYKDFDKLTQWEW